MCYLESEHDIENIRKATMRMVFAVSDDGLRPRSEREGGSTQDGSGRL